VTAVHYVYAITREPVSVAPGVEAIDCSNRFGAVTAAGVTAVHTPVSREEFSQEAIDSRASDLEWLGAIGYRHQGVVSHLMKATAVVPLRAFSLFSSEEAIEQYLRENAELLRKLLERLDGKQEWTLRVEFDAQRWSESLVGRVEALRDIQQQIESAGEGKAFLLRKKLDDERKKASKLAEQQVVAEIERAVLDKLACDTVAESRQQREGAFPQINVLVPRDEESRLQELHNELMTRYASEGVSVALTGPWPPYSFAGAQHG
jgi:gas vesicle protein GvpL/GvpF